MVLHGGHIAVNGRRSAESLYDFNLATYDEGDSFDQSTVEGLRLCARVVVEARGPPGPAVTVSRRADAKAPDTPGAKGLLRLLGTET